MTTLLAAIGGPAACGGSTSGSVGTEQSGGTGNTPPGLECTPVANSTWSGGFVECAEGYVHRVSQAECAPSTPPAGCDPARMDTAICSKDADCYGAPYGVCAAMVDGTRTFCDCAYMCRRDADCFPDFVCGCQGTNGGLCIPAVVCKTDADCTPGQCQVTQSLCGSAVMQCVMPPTPNDSCANDRDCGQGYFCAVRPNGRMCTAAGCGGIGRPFLVEGMPRRASVVRRSDWASAKVPTLSDDLDSGLRACLAAAWTELGQMEHASIAAFARFTLELLAFGAPSDLVEQAQAAMADETRHAKLCFALASAYAGRDIGPGALEMSGVALGADLETSVITAFIEGCVGETVAAAEAKEAARFATDPAVATLLTAIAEDEARHAALAWRFVAWALRSSAPGVRTRILAELARAGESALRASTAKAHPVPLEQYGFLSPARRSQLAGEVHSQVVRPCLAALAASMDELGLRAQTALDLPRQG
jgi:hypothetical protein